MTDSPTPAEPGPVDPDVELASAHLDGEAGEDERARVDDPTVQAHRTAFAAVADQVRDVPPPPPGLLDDHVAAAMGAFDDDARVVPLDRSRVAPPPWWQRIPLGAVAAGLVVVALIGAIGLASTGDDDDADTAATALDAGGAGDEGADAADDTAAEDDGASAGAAQEESATFDAGDEAEAQVEAAEGGRPAHDTVEALVEDVRAQLAADPDRAGAPTAESDPTTTRPDDGSDPCGAVALLGIDPADVVLVRPALLASTEVTVVVHDAADGRLLVVVDDATCAVTHERTL